MSTQPRPRKRAPQPGVGAVKPAAAPAKAAETNSHFPRKLRHSTQRPDLVYELEANLYATREGAGSATREAVVLTVDGEHGEQFWVYRGQPARPRGVTPAVYPVYAHGPGRMIIPTGRLLVRFADSINAVSRADDLNRAGYRIAQALSYAPNAAWIEAEADSLDAALNNIERVERIPDVQNVEPQFIAPRASRT